MLKNYLKIAIRNISKNKLYSFINIAGLAIGMACFILIMLWVQDELSYERYNKNADRICSVIWDMDGTSNLCNARSICQLVKRICPRYPRGNQGER